MNKTIDDLRDRIARVAETPEQYHARQRDTARDNYNQAIEADRVGQDVTDDRDGAKRAIWRILTINADGTATAEASWGRTRHDAPSGYRRSRFQLIATPSVSDETSTPLRVLTLGAEIEVEEQR